MPGGQYDSSKTRAVPVFEQLKTREGDWVRELLVLPSHGSGAPIPPTIDLSFVSGYWGVNERALWPPVALLSWLIRNLSPPVGPTQVIEERTRLLSRHAPTIETALELLRSAGQTRGWHVLEGPTYPDAIIETPGALIVVEGKRTESGPTTHTTWMAARHQIWRHMDAAWEIRGQRAVFGLFLVEGVPPDRPEIPRAWQTACGSTLGVEALEGSFPHRSYNERESIAQGFLGVSTWQCVCLRFGLSFDALPKTVAELDG